MQSAFSGHGWVPPVPVSRSLTSHAGASRPVTVPGPPAGRPGPAGPWPARQPALCPFATPPRRSGFLAVPAQTTVCPTRTEAAFNWYMGRPVRVKKMAAPAIRHISQFAPHEITTEGFKESLHRTIDALTRAAVAQVGQVVHGDWFPHIWTKF